MFPLSRNGIFVMVFLFTFYGARLVWLVPQCGQWRHLMSLLMSTVFWMNTKHLLNSSMYNYYLIITPYNILRQLELVVVEFIVDNRGMFTLVLNHIDNFVFLPRTWGCRLKTVYSRASVDNRNRGIYWAVSNYHKKKK